MTRGGTLRPSRESRCACKWVWCPNVPPLQRKTQAILQRGCAEDLVFEEPGRRTTHPQRKRRRTTRAKPTGGVVKTNAEFASEAERRRPSGYFQLVGIFAWHERRQLAPTHESQLGAHPPAASNNALRNGRGAAPLAPDSGEEVGLTRR